MALNAKQKGNRWELTCAHFLQPIFPKVVTARSTDRAADAAGIDLVKTGNWAFQCKHVERGLDLFKTLEGMPVNTTNVVLWKRNRKGALAVLEMQTMLEIISQLERMRTNESGANTDVLPSATSLTITQTDSLTTLDF
jgi:hypothetical protein